MAIILGGRMNEVAGSNSIVIALVSDSTAATAEMAARAATVQFKHANIEKVEHPMVVTNDAIDRVLQQHTSRPTVIVYTFANPARSEHLQTRAKRLGIPAIDLIEPILSSMEALLHQSRGHDVGAQHRIDGMYEERIAAMEFANQHDDGAGMDTIHQADIILVGVSRTSKTPTCMYLAFRGYRAANIPLVQELGMPPILDELKGVPIVGLSVNPNRLAQVRENRMRALGDKVASYSKIDQVKEEIIWAKQQMATRGWATVNVTGRAVEETVTEIVQILNQSKSSAVANK